MKLLALAALVLTLPQPGPAAAPLTQEGEGTWINHIGAPPTPENLKGRAVVLMFFGPASAQESINWGLLRSLHHEWDGKVTFLGIFDGSAAGAQIFADDRNLFFPIGVDTGLRDHFAVTAQEHQLLLDREGAIFWSGPLAGLWDGKLRKGASGAANAFGERALFLHPRRAYDGAVGRAADKLRKGELGKAYEALRRVADAERSEPDERAGAEELLELLRSHVERLHEQIEGQIGLGEALRAREALELIERDLRKTPFGARLRERLDELEEDEDFQRELRADKDFADLYRAWWKRAPSKSKKKIGFFLEEHAGTRAARKARVLLQA